MRRGDQRSHGCQVGQVDAESAGLHEHVADGGRLHRSGQDRPAQRVGRESAHEVVLRAAAHDVHNVDGATGQLGRLADRRRISRSQAVEDAANHRRPVRRRFQILARHAETIRAGMSPGGRKSGESMSTTGPP